MLQQVMYSKISELMSAAQRVIGPRATVEDCVAFIEEAVNDKVALMSQEPTEEKDND